MNRFHIITITPLTCVMISGCHIAGIRAHNLEYTDYHRYVVTQPLTVKKRLADNAVGDSIGVLMRGDTVLANGSRETARPYQSSIKEYLVPFRGDSGFVEVDEQTGVHPDGRLDPNANFVRVAWLHPLKFTMPKSQRDVAWERAQVFIAHWSTYSLSVNPAVIQTVVPSRFAPHSLEFSVTRLGQGSSDEYSVWCSQELYAPAWRLAYFIHTGDKYS